MTFGVGGTDSGGENIRRRKKKEKQGKYIGRETFGLGEVSFCIPLTFGGPKSLIDGTCGPLGGPINAPVEEQHHEHGDVEGPQGRVDDVSGVVCQLAGPRAGGRIGGRFAHPSHFPALGNRGGGYGAESRGRSC